MTRRFPRAISTAAICLLPALAPAAEDKFYVGGAGTGNWSTFQNWSPAGAPLDGDNAMLTPTDAAARTVRYDLPGGAITNLGLVTVAPLGSGSITLLNTHNQFRAEELIIGPRGGFTQPQNASAIVVTARLQGGSITSAGGQFSAHDVFHSGGQLGAGTCVTTGFYRLTGGSISGASIINHGTFIHSGGFATGGSIVNHGTFSYLANTGSLNLHVENRGTAILGSNNRLLSFETFTPVVLHEQSLLLASTSGVGIAISGGTFTQRGDVVADRMRVAGGVWVQHSGALTANSQPGQFIVGADGQRGEYHLRGGEAFFADEVKIGSAGAFGYVVQDGGSVTALRAPIIGGAGGTAFYEMKAGSLNASGMLIGQSGAVRGAFGMTGGNVSVGTLLIREGGNAGGELGVGGGTFHVASTTVNNASLNQGGGTTRFDGGITGEGRIDMGGGSMIASSISQNRVTLFGAARLRTTAGAATPSNVAHLTLLEQGVGGAINGQWDLGSGRLIVTDLQATPLERIRQYIRSGYKDGSWTGAGLVSSTAAQSGRTGLGYRQVGQTAVIAHALYGDADLSGQVGISDFAVLASNFNRPGDWPMGDFNYDAVIGISDFALLAGNFNQATARSPSAVPESIGLPALACGGLMRRRRGRAA